jgi:hypothetical protein
VRNWICWKNCFDWTELSMYKTSTHQIWCWLERSFYFVLTGFCLKDGTVSRNLSDDRLLFKFGDKNYYFHSSDLSEIKKIKWVSLRWNTGLNFITSILVNCCSSRQGVNRVWGYTNWLPHIYTWVDSRWQKGWPRKYREGIRVDAAGMIKKVNYGAVLFSSSSNKNKQQSYTFS